MTALTRRALSAPLLLQIQMYNTWAQVETIAYAEQYVQQLLVGYVVAADDETFNVTIPASKLVLGYPASPSGAGSGYIAPSDVVESACGPMDVCSRTFALCYSRSRPYCVLRCGCGAAVVRALASNGTAIAGLMTWSIGWDHLANWEFANAVAAGQHFIALTH